METIKIAFVDFWPEWQDENFITPILQKSYNVIIDQNNPDVLFYSIFGNSHVKYTCKKILYVAENIRYPYNQNIRNNINIAFSSANYTITFDPHTETNFRLPLWQVFILRNTGYLDKLLNRVIHNNFDRFASFVVSNSSNFIRNGMFSQLSAYKFVHSYGKYMTNDYGLQNISSGKYWRDAKDEFFLKNKHKFAITYENTSYPYYCTEKLMDGFLAGSLPLYWGSPNVEDEFNSKSFINIIKYSNPLNIIKKLDTDNQYFNSFYNEPIFTDTQKDKLLNNLSEFENWLILKTNN